ncbi:DUF2989 domain-containing protein [Alteromonas lipolytica]|uniref:DUF2989 domain-containing protein n=1 Tax=Alteromonas lipolytica TaxID=1856405 RepID=UPI0015869361|nr:DUF2989 domain-containing protein [Alteromonas lipolytica]
MKIFRKPLKTTIYDNLFSKFSTFKPATLPVFSLVLLTGCGDLFAPSVKSICEDYPHFCADLNTDGWCRAERSDIIRHRFDYKDDKSDRPKYDLLINYEKYQSCISKASQIEYIKYREKEFARKDATVSINKALKQLQWQTKNSPDPYISYYQWSRFGNEAAKGRFIAAAKQGVFTEPKYYSDLAGILIDEDPRAARDALFMALSQYANVDQEIDGHIASMLMTLSLDTENYRMAYVWTKVTNHFANNINNAQLLALGQQYALPVDILDRLAGEITDAIEAREFDAKTLKIDRL